MGNTFVNYGIKQGDKIYAMEGAKCDGCQSSIY